MSRFKRYFTIEEALHELPALKGQLDQIRALMEELKAAQVENERIVELVRSNGHGSGHKEYGHVVSQIQRHVSDIEERGIELKDLDRGLVDFPHWRNGEEVYLCWLRDEETIYYWHTIDDGFRGRSPL